MKRWEGWADYAEDLGTLLDKAFPTLQNKAGNSCLTDIHLPARSSTSHFRHRTGAAKTLNEAVRMTLEMEGCFQHLDAQLSTASTCHQEMKDVAVELLSIAAVEPTVKLTNLFE